ncbi:MAG: LytTR family DNA-binding domain-containing protein [Lachnospiraceae bacterium]|nr:LytTR family DNA-binding domain-containing protein [Lachnospiraceae bacterium]
MKIRIAIVEDSKEYRNQLFQIIKRYFEEKPYEYEVEGFCDGLDIIDEYKAGYDLIFMDIDMRHLDGMSAAKSIRKKDSEVVIVFVTNLAQYAVKGYEVGAFDFIVKPLSYPDFSFKMDKVINRIATNQKRDIFLKFGGGMYHISSDRLCYVEVQGHNLFYHLVDETLEVRGRLADVETDLKKSCFIRCNNCYLVNPKYVEWVKDYELKVGGDTLKISRSRKKQVLEELSEYISRGM